MLASEPVAATQSASSSAPRQASSCDPNGAMAMQRPSSASTAAIDAATSPGVTRIARRRLREHRRAQHQRREQREQASAAGSSPPARRPSRRSPTACCCSRRRARAGSPSSARGEREQRLAAPRREPAREALAHVLGREARDARQLRLEPPPPRRARIAPQLEDPRERRERVARRAAPQLQRRPRAAPRVDS